MRRLEVVRKLILPAAWPEIVVAARLALTISLVLVIVTEMIGNPAGVGYALVSAQQGLQPELMWAFLLMAGLIGVALHSILNFASRRAMPGLAPQLITGAR